MSANPVTFKNHFRIVVTGGPGGGKTTAVDLFRRELGECVVVVPEAATMLFSGGFPRSEKTRVGRLTQKAIYHVQKTLEDIHSEEFTGRALVCDRGTLDGAAYWPNHNVSFFEALDTSREAELARYDGVIFFESAAVGGISIEGGNPTRNESLNQAVALDAKLRDVWSDHPNFVLVPHRESFMEKINLGLSEIHRLLRHLSGEAL